MYPLEILKFSSVGREEVVGPSAGGMATPAVVGEFKFK